jgi:hypothetical protein
MARSVRVSFAQSAGSWTSALRRSAVQFGAVLTRPRAPPISPEASHNRAVRCRRHPRRASVRYRAYRFGWAGEPESRSLLRAVSSGRCLLLPVPRTLTPELDCTGQGGVVLILWIAGDRSAGGAFGKPARVDWLPTTTGLSLTCRQPPGFEEPALSRARDGSHASRTVLAGPRRPEPESRVPVETRPGGWGRHDSAHPGHCRMIRCFQLATAALQHVPPDWTPDSRWRESGAG